MDPARQVVVVSAAGKRTSDDHKITDLLYLCSAHIKYGVSCGSVFQMIKDRYISIRNALELKTDLESAFDELYQEMSEGISEEKLVSRGEYFSAKLMADFLGYEFIDAAMWLQFSMDGSVDQESSYEALKRLAAGRKCVIP